MKHILVVFIAFLSSNLNASPTCSQHGTKVIYTNGINTSFRNATYANLAIENLNIGSQIDIGKVQYVLRYNYSESFSEDFLESAVQRFPREYLNSIKKTKWEAFTLFLSGSLSVPDLIIESIEEDFLTETKEFLESRTNIPLYIQNVSEITKEYQNSLDGVGATGRMRVLAISHSQGGLFMKDAFEQLVHLSKWKYFAGFQIATPIEEEMNSYFGYATHDKDRVIDLLRFTAGALPANITAPLIVDNSFGVTSDYLQDFILNHGMVTTYLNDSTIKSQVLPKLIQTAQLLESNCIKAVINYTKNNLQVNFDSIDPQNPSATDLTYTWDFGDGQTEVTTSKTLSHNYSAAGTYNISLVVTDTDGFSDEEEIIINVSSSIEPYTEVCNTDFTNLTFHFEGMEAFTLNARVRESISCECKIIYPGDITGTRLSITSSDLYTRSYSAPLPDGSIIGWHYEQIPPYVIEDYISDIVFELKYIKASVSNQVNEEYPHNSVVTFFISIFSSPQQSSFCQNIVYK